MAEALGQAFAQVVLDPTVWGVILASALYGIFIGSVPGLTATTATALLVPVTFWLPPVPALAAIVTMTACAIFAGDTPSTLMRIPGTPASAAYTEDAYGLARRGKADLALGVALVSSIVGGLFGSLVLIGSGHWLARSAAWFSAAEYFWLYLLGLSCAVIISQDSVLKGLFGMLLGLMLSTVGLSAVHPQPRFTFNQPELYQGINFIAAMIGLFGFSAVLKDLAQPNPATPIESDVDTAPHRHFGKWLRRLLAEPWRLMVRRPAAALRSGLIGAGIGILPGAGADIAAWVTTAVTRRLQGGRPQGEEAALERLCDAGNANNSALAGAWIPALVFGIPGDSVTAIVIGVLLMKNVQPGPEIFVQQTVLVYSLYLLFIIANLILLPVGLMAIALGNRVVRVPRRVLMPIILMFCVVGSFALNGSAFDVGVMLAMGLVGFLLERRNVPLGPVVLGIILGGPLEERFIQTATGAGGSWLGFVDRPVAAFLGAAWLLLWVSIVVQIIRRRRSGSLRPGPAAAPPTETDVTPPAMRP
jgi:TctA family transporter